MVKPLEGTRLEIVAIIRERGRVTVEQLAQAMGLSSATVRRHLDILQRDQLVSCQQSRKQLGRPEFLFSLTEAGHESGYRDYQTLLTHLLRTVKEQSPSEFSDKFGDELLSYLMYRVADRLSTPLPENSSFPRDTRVAKLQQALNDNGFEPQIDQHNGNVEIRLCNCPFRAAALCEESVCLFDQRMITNILGVEPFRKTSIRNGDPVCSYTVQLND